jgi:hypothetical protein
MVPGIPGRRSISIYHIPAWLGKGSLDIESVVVRHHHHHHGHHHHCHNGLRIWKIEMEVVGLDLPPIPCRPPYQEIDQHIPHSGMAWEGIFWDDVPG